ncbi:phosphatidylinositol N-acetylglucosaminyltransferase subunit H-like [Eriocheir sinensis]|uniref:phosphatidylinositol N-acetylglucosaminyltransferase subunit H-like n=1 Tax=Eriocheir sinensis TaxID=95602 RepID=UPI0021C77BFE|nr:phosphatidylinositol N-acetylglucosaminyltransferase subunit H-like [Eriocheir sinensis]XP_050711577.1 phosphatidylinositol N-acetylglucosaminyltransferase subunit H-like [Eriocheir sinensis]XP_050711578.1 phosphatidylinositol N-acetylglucosaminyltransferase subunit H-like [Eriocheir sinensis]XP_050711579.1 phosphatidylinositol N-acetylglucosaminyltransferase subunit H-like [Eriocheir sinensis]XP_050711580.1 phosphatidylinositol N-acetylglucosaminyltransferase subunit H-like [Eriocheir sinen
MQFRNVQGEPIYVTVRLNQQTNKRAIEVNVSGGRIQLLPWVGYTTILTVVAFVIQFHTLHLGWLFTAVFMQLATLMYRIHGKIVSETLLVVAGLGIQTTATFYMGKRHTRFIPWGSVIDILLAETISMQRVLFYMALLVKAETTVQNRELIPLFLNTWPRLACLQYTYSACQDILNPSLPISKR